MTGSKNRSYAGQVFVAKRTTQMLSVTDRLVPVSEEADEPFLEIFSDRSVYLVSILKTLERTSVIANIPLRDMFDIIDNMHHANRMIFEHGLGNTSGNSDDTASKAFQKLGMGRYKGRSPAEMLLSAQDPKAVISELNSHLSFLKENLSKFPGNQSYIDSINDAISLYEAGRLTESSNTIASATPSESVAIYSPPIKYFRQMNPEGTKNKCYGIKISCRPGNTYPYHIDIRNFFAPVAHKSNGITPILLDKSEQETGASIDLTKQEFILMLEKMYRNYACYSQELYQKMREEDGRRQWKPDGSH